jgi:hypothetical protein
VIAIPIHITPKKTREFLVARVTKELSPLLICICAFIACINIIIPKKIYARTFEKRLMIFFTSSPFSLTTYFITCNYKFFKLGDRDHEYISRPLHGQYRFPIFSDGLHP